MNILKIIDLFGALEKMLKNLAFSASPKQESLIQFTWGFLF